jgi:PAS domain S-box-containing protein
VRICGWTAVAIGGYWFAAWMTGYAAAWSAHGERTMKTNLALAEMLSGAALLLLCGTGPLTRTRRFPARLAAFAVLAIGALTLSEHLIGWNLHIDQILASEPPGASATASPNQMGLPGSVGLVLLGAGLLCLRSRREALASYLGLAVCAIGLIPAVGFLYRIEQLYDLPRLTAIVWPTVAAFIVLGSGLILARGRKSFVNLLLQDDAGGHVLRRLLPAVLLVPLILGFLRVWGERRGVFGTETGNGILVIVLVLTFSALLWQSAAHLSRVASAQRRAEDALRDTAERFRTLADNISQLAWMADEKGRIFWYNKRWHDYTGATLDEMHTQGWQKVHHPEHVQRVMERMNRCFANGTDWEDTFPLRGKAGNYRWFLTHAIPVKDGNGAVVRWFGTHTDITEQRQAHEALHRQAALIDLTPDAIIVRDLHGTIKLWSTGAENLYGWKKEEAIGRNVEALLRTEFPEPAAKILEHLQRERNWNGELVHYTRSAHMVIVQSSWHMETIDCEAEILESDVDITSRRRLENELRLALTSAERANQAKDQFLAVLSHELRTPLTPVLAAVSLLKKRDDLPAQVQDRLEIIQRNVSVEARLIDDLLDLTRIIRGKVSLEKVKVDICEILDRIAEVCRPDIEAKQLHFGTDFKTKPIPVDADFSRLQQVFWNLLNNSVKFTAEGGCVGVRTFAEGGNAIVEVTDSGIGIESENLPKVFDAFEQGGHGITRQFGGLGLGLAITKRLVEMHGGSISAESPGRNGGATFRVTLPLALPAEAGSGACIDAGKGRAPGPSLTGRVLLVEDHTDTAIMMKELLQISGFEVETAADVAQSLKAAGSRHFDLMISDLGLPDRSGLELIRELRHLNNPLKAIALSGYGREEDIQRSKEAGFSEHLTKPVDLDMLLASVRRVIFNP